MGMAAPTYGRGRGAEPAAPGTAKNVWGNYRTQTGAYQPSARQQQSRDLMAQLQGIWNMGRIANAPGETAIDNNLTSYMQQLGLIGANKTQQTGYINQDKGYGLERLGLSREGIGLQRGALARENVLDPRLHQLSMEELQQQGQQNAFAAQGQRRQLSSQATTAGSMVSQGAREGFGDIAQQLQFGQRDVLRGAQRENLSFQERQSQRADQKSQLDLAAKGLDIDGRELETRTSRALQELGLSSALSTQDVVRAMNDLNAGRYNPIQAMLGTIYQASGVRPVARGKK